MRCVFDFFQIGALYIVYKLYNVHCSTLVHTLKTLNHTIPQNSTGAPLGKTAVNGGAKKFLLPGLNKHQTAFL